MSDLKACIAAFRYQAAFSVNKELIVLYNHIGTAILTAQKAQGWGAKVIDQLSKDLGNVFPEMKGFSIRNLKYMRKLAEEYGIDEFSQQGIDQIPWGHSVTLIYGIADKVERRFYIYELAREWYKSAPLREMTVFCIDKLFLVRSILLFCLTFFGMGERYENYFKTDHACAGTIMQRCEGK